MAGALAREQILTEARDLFMTEGTGGITMRGIASRLGVTPMALYRHFESRDELIAALVEQGHSTFLQYLNRALAAETPSERLFAAGHQYLAFALDHPRAYDILFVLQTESGREARDEASAWRDRATFRFLVDRIRDAAEARVLQVEDAEAAALTVWAQVHGLVSLYLAGKLGMTRDRFERLYLASLQTLMSGLGATK